MHPAFLLGSAGNSSAGPSTLLLGTEGKPKSPLTVVLSETTQLLSWLLAILIVVNFQKTKTLRLPWTLRIWWVCGFLQSVTTVIVHLHSIISRRRYPEVREFVGLLSFLPASYLFCVSIRGSTGISFFTGTISEPLLQREREKDDEDDNRRSLYATATFIQLVTFSWFNPLFVRGNRKPLERGEVPDVDKTNSAEFLSQSFDDSLRRVKQAHELQTSSVYSAVFLFIRKKALVNAAFAVLTACASYVGPYLIDDLIKFLSEKRSQSLRSGYILSVGFLSAKIVETVAQRQWIFGARQLGMRLRAALTSQIYKKGLLLSSLVDVERITDFIWYLNIIWMLPVQISLATYILHINLGLGSLVALAATGMVMACNFPVIKLMKGFQSRIMEAKDHRMRATSEVLRNMKTLKLHAWDTQYLRKLEGLRETERHWLWKSLRLQAISAFIFWASPTFISAVTFGTCILMDIPLTAGRVLSALATFRMLQDPIFNLPDLLQVIAQAKVSADRVASYLQEDEIKKDSVEIIDGGRFSWDHESSSATLEDIHLTVKRGMKVAICGTVGSGKSSLLSCVLGEIPKLAGRSPWILTGNVRENILFGQAFEGDRYERVIQVCALAKDFELFASGDLTEIGERGINVSGGQKQRIQIARAVYQDSDIYLLDDPFSAVDAHTGSQLFKATLLLWNAGLFDGILKDKTILYVTHQVEFLPAADLILVMKNGRISQAGRFEELLQENVGFEVLVGAHSQALGSVLAVGNSPQIEETHERGRTAPSGSGEEDEEHPARIKLQNGDSVDRKQERRIGQDEERETGSIDKEVYWTYLTAVRGGIFVPMIITAQCLFQALQVAGNYWIAWASPSTEGIKPAVDIAVLFVVYVLLSVVSSLFVLVRAMLIAIAGLQTSEKFFANMLHSIMRAPMLFLDSTPTGRILNRASTDQSVLDMEIAIRIGWCALSVAWPVFAIFVPVTAICIWYQRYYTPTARELARLSGIQRSPILHHFAESLAGAAVIRAFEHSDRFTDKNMSLIDDYSRPWFHNISAMEWLSFRLNLLSHFVFAFSLVLLVSLPDGVIRPSIAGLAVTYGLNLNVQQASIIWNLCNAENKMISVERILQYSRIESEGPLHVEGCRPPTSWPEIGTICLKDLQVRYAERLPSVLKSITCTFPGKKKIGVVGRTGSGKSTLIQAIFRIVEPRAGSIVIDGIDISKIGLHDLRSRLMRCNLDPLEEYSDLQVWEAVEKCQLGDLVRDKGKKLEATVVENGENWSVGQRQLTILVLDEATASVDSATDSAMQKIIRQEFIDSTVITIAHRIHTVIDSDLVLVLSEGKVHEYDTPARLLERPDSEFSRLIREYSLRSHSFNNLANVPGDA
ncbi:unnamed protein product [Spirodela intermedia]|uniref:Uncharacterized protein n=1 Tax=Spirodela intermedia TaxID=51605 RepID=A0A7I8JWF5_SPIIN|nr:unnamed protein product [Spirodela intermedia]CAA6673812.1 unnamed protein product [Spirodela intermedia]